jgi:hypothetical protein
LEPCIFYFSIQLGMNHNPKWRSHIFQRGWNHQPDVYGMLWVKTLYWWAK